MAKFYKTKLSECETFEDFKNTLYKENYSTILHKEEGFYGVEQYSKVFKGFDPDCQYINYTRNENIFLPKVCYYELANFTSPIFDTKNKTVTYFESEEKRSKGIRSNPTKMGKFFRKITPYFNDKQIEFLVNYVVDYYAESDYTHNIAKGDKISEIYLSRAEGGRNVGDYSCINASCMRYNHWEIHPTKVYATESWELHYLTNEEGDIGARALVCKEDGTYSYIYASCVHAGDTLREKLNNLGLIDCQEAYHAFEGAKLLKIECDGRIVAPYIDYHSDVKDFGEHLEITYKYADYSFKETSGYVHCEVYCECNSCGGETHEDNFVFVNGEIFCECCTFFCDHFNAYAVGEPISVHYSLYSYYYVCEDALEVMGAIYNENEDEWQTPEWYKECTKEIEEDLKRKSLQVLSVL